MADPKLETAFKDGLYTVRNYMAGLRRDNPNARPDFSGMEFRSDQRMASMPLQNAEFRGIRSQRLQLDRSDLTDARFNGAELYRVVLRDATIDGCDFSCANMTGALLDNVTDQGLATSIWFNTRLHRVVQTMILAAIWRNVMLVENGKGKDDPGHHMTEEQIALRTWWQAELSEVGRDRVINAIGRFMLTDEPTPRKPNSRNKRPVVYGPGPFAPAEIDPVD